MTRESSTTSLTKTFPRKKVLLALLLMCIEPVASKSRSFTIPLPQAATRKLFN